VQPQSNTDFGERSRNNKDWLDWSKSRDYWHLWKKKTGWLGLSTRRKDSYGSFARMRSRKSMKGRR
jgi:hypothetical protein